MTGRTLMIQGTSSSAGKSLLVAALCRIFARRGMRVAPFKAQNMSNNAAVCADGGEIGRSQALQALAAGIAPAVDMNPVLLKPEADSRSQVVVQGRPWLTLEARDYYQTRETLWPVVASALDRMRREFDLVVIEGAGSPAELNLKDRDIVNMAVARHCQAPVLLVGDIERGGVFAQLLGTLWLLPDAERHLVQGLIVNKFRGDATLFESGRDLLEQRGGVPVLGVVPWLDNLGLPEEDGQPLDEQRSQSAGLDDLDVAVIRLPRIANFDDFDPLAAETGVRLRFVSTTERLGRPQAVILPGTKSTVADLAWLRQSGLAQAILQLSQQGTAVVGICGGYQMLGRVIRDPAQVESSTAETAGLGLLPVETTFARTKDTHQVLAMIEDDRHCGGCRGQSVRGYEIHMGQSAGGRPWLNFVDRGGNSAPVQDGAVSHDGRTWGCYLHGLFANDAFRGAWLSSLRASAGLRQHFAKSSCSHELPGQSQRIEAALDRLAGHVQQALDMVRLEEIVWSSQENAACLTT